LQALVTLRGKLHDSVAFGTGDMLPPLPGCCISNLVALGFQGTF
jgi:hypothetical protein